MNGIAGYWLADQQKTPAKRALCDVKLLIKSPHLPPFISRSLNPPSHPPPSSPPKKYASKPPHLRQTQIRKTGLPMPGKSHPHLLARADHRRSRPPNPAVNPGRNAGNLELPPRGPAPDSVRIFCGGVHGHRLLQVQAALDLPGGLLLLQAAGDVPRPLLHLHGTF